MVDEANGIVSEIPELLILPLDGSRAADRAVPAVRDIASQLGIVVRVVHVFQSIKQLRSLAVDNIEWSEDAEPRAVIRSPASIRQAITEMTHAGLDVEIIGRVGDPAVEITRESSSTSGAWVVMSTLGSSGIRRLFLGSTARAVIRASSRPVLLVPSQLSDDDYVERKLRERVAVFLDGSAQAESAICYAAGLAEAFSLDLDLVRVAETYLDDPAQHGREYASWEETARAATEGYLDKVSRACRRIQVPLNRVVLSGSPRVQLIEYVRRESPNLVAIATRKRSGVERWTYGSLAERLVDSLAIPLLLVSVQQPDD